MQSEHVKTPAPRVQQPRLVRAAPARGWRLLHATAQARTVPADSLALRLHRKLSWGPEWLPSAELKRNILLSEPQTPLWKLEF